MKLIIDMPEGMKDAFEHDEQWTALLCADMRGVLEKAISFDEFAEKIKQDLFKFASNSFDDEYAECYRIALRCVEGHLKEVENHVL